MLANEWLILHKSISPLTRSTGGPDLSVVKVNCNDFRSFSEKVMKALLEWLWVDFGQRLQQLFFEGVIQPQKLKRQCYLFLVHSWELFFENEKIITFFIWLVSFTLVNQWKAQSKQLCLDRTYFHALGIGLGVHVFASNSDYFILRFSLSFVIGRASEQLPWFLKWLWIYENHTLTLWINKWR